MKKKNTKLNKKQSLVKTSRQSNYFLSLLDMTKKEQAENLKLIKNLEKMEKKYDKKFKKVFGLLEQLVTKKK